MKKSKFKEGQTVFFFGDEDDYSRVKEGKLTYYDKYFLSDVYSEGWLVKAPTEYMFLTEEEAEKALKEWKEGGKIG